VISSRVVHDGWVRLRVDALRWPSGNETSADVVEHPGGVTVLAFDDQDLLLLVRQHRHPAGRPLVELPAGTLEPGEDPALCASRELQEETGYRARSMERLGGFFTAPGYCSEYLHVFLARDLVESKLDGDEEDIQVERVPWAEAVSRATSGAIEDAKTLAALFLAQHLRSS
jgi:ADP-ribose pyrophosphatase